MKHFHFLLTLAAVLVLLTLARHLDGLALMAGFTVGFVFLAIYWLVPEFETGRPKV